MRRAVEFMIPYIRDKKSWPLKPDVMYNREWPMRHASLLFAGLSVVLIVAALDDPTPFLKNSKRFRIVEHLLLQPNDKFAIQPVFIYQRTQSGNPRDARSCRMAQTASPSNAR